MPGKKFPTLSKLLFIVVFSLFASGCGQKVENADAATQEAVNLIVNKGNYKDAVSYAKMALKADPNDVNAQVVYAFSLSKLGKQPEAIKLLRNTILANHDNFLAQLALGQILYSQGKYEEAYEYLGNAYALNSSNTDIILVYAQCAGKLRTKKTPELYTELSKTKQFFDKPEIYNNMGVYYTQTQDYNQALRNFLKAYRLDTNNPTVVANLAILRDQFMRDPRQARFFYRKFISLTIDNSAFNTERDYFSMRLRDLRN